MTETGKHVFKIHIQASREAVWERLTCQGEVLPHFFGSVMHTAGLRPGSPLRMRTKDGKYTAVVGDILECDPPHRFSHTFRFTNYDDPECVVIYELAESSEGGVDFTLTLENVPVGTKTEKNMIDGGKIITDTMKAMVETGKPTWTSWMILKMGPWMQPFTPKRCRSEHWPLQAPAEVGTPV